MTNGLEIDKKCDYTRSSKRRDDKSFRELLGAGLAHELLATRSVERGRMSCRSSSSSKKEDPSLIAQLCQPRTGLRSEERNLQWQTMLGSSTDRAKVNARLKASLENG